MGVMLPIVFHMLPLGGRIFLPMHIPVFIAGLVLGPVAGLIVGAGSPVLSALVTGRPAVFYMVPMVFELATYGVVAGVLRPSIAAVLSARQARRERGGAQPAASSMTAAVISLVVAMIAGRVVWIAVVVWLAPVIGIRARSLAMALGALGAGWIGMAIQIGLVPAIVRAIERIRNP